MSTFASGQICVPSDTIPTRGVLIALPSNVVTAAFTATSNNWGGVIPASSQFGFHGAGADTNAYIYDFSFNLLHTVAALPGTVMLSDYASKYYLFHNGSPATIKTISTAGVVGGTTFSLTGTTGVASAAVNNAGTIAYFAESATAGAIKRWDLSGNASLGTLVPGRAGSAWGISAICLPNGDRAGDILFPVTLDEGDIGSGTSAWQIERYTPSGQLVQVYPLPTPSAATGNVIILSVDLTYPNTFWVRTFPDAVSTTFMMFSLNGNLVLPAFTLLSDETNPAAVPVSCPMFGFSEVLTPAPPSGPFAPNDGSDLFIGSETVVPLKRQRRIPLPILPGNANQVVGRVELQFEAGTGFADESAVAPQWMLAVSFNSGQTFGTARQMSAGREGQFYTRAYANALGTGRFPVLDLSCTDPFNSVLTDVQVTMEPQTG